LYSYQHTNNADNLPTLNGIGVSHEASPWIGDRERFVMMPQLINAINTAPHTNRDGSNGRQLPFLHDNEIAKPDYYSVTFQNKMRVELTPSSHSAIMRITYPSTQNFGSLIFTSGTEGVKGSKFVFGNDTIYHDINAFTGYVDNGSSSADDNGGDHPSH
jgi:putative alpha-1,2-mannosidase